MRTPPLGHALRRLCRSTEEQTEQDLSDADLLQRFRAGREETAFALLVQRHGPMVHGVCRRVLGDVHEAEDAFQATFLVLVRQAAVIRQREALGGWLYRVAYRVAARARGSQSRRRAVASQAPVPAAVPDPAATAAWGELRHALDEELHRLPDKYRAPVVLCCLEGKTHEQAGRELHWPKSSVTARLERARELLQQRLVRRGFVLPAGLLAALLAAETSSAAVPATLLLATVRLALQVLRGEPAAAPGVALAEGVLRGMARTRLAVAAAVCLVLGLAVAGVGALAQPKTGGAAGAGEGSAAEPVEKDADQAEPAAAISGTVTDQDGNAIPGARVWLREGERPKLQFRSTNADDRGRFRFADVVPGQATVLALVRGRSFAGQSRDLQAGQAANDLNLVLTPPHELRLAVTGEDGKPVKGVELEHLAWKTPRADWFWPPLEVLRREKLPITASDASGALVVQGIPQDAVCRGRLRHPDFARSQFEQPVPGDKAFAVRLAPGWPLTVVAVGPDGKPATAATVSLQGFPDSINLSDEPVGPDGKLTVRLGKASDITIMVRHPEWIAPKWDRWEEWNSTTAGYVFKVELRRRTKASGRVVDEKGQPVPGASVGLNPFNVNQIITTVQSDASGRFEIEGPEGQANIQVLGGHGYWAEHGAGAFVRLDPARTVQAADLLVKRLPRVRGTVVLPDGKPLARALVVERSSFHGPSVLTDAAGRFEFPLDERVEYVAVAGCHLTERLSGVTTMLFEDLQANKELRIQLQPETTLTGRVVDADGKPRAGVVVWLRTETRCGTWSSYTNTATATTDEQGRYRFQGLNRALRYQIAFDNKLSSKSGPHSAWLALDQTKIEVPPLTAPADLAPERKRPAREAAPVLGCQAWFNSPPLRLEALHGKVVLLDFWATWCGPCVADLPQVQTAHDVFADRGLVVVGIHHNSVPAKDVEAFLKKRRLTFAVGLDNPEGLTCGRYNVNAFPTKVLIGRDGKILQNPVVGGDVLGTVRQAVLYDGAEE
jgi:RNA polymerase sigma factor (sigma-70 family)